MNYNIYRPINIIFKRNAILSLSKILKTDSVIIITSPSIKKAGLLDRFYSSFKGTIVKEFYCVKQNPSIVDIENIYMFFKDVEFDKIIAIGGGSVIDTAKCFSYLVSNDIASFKKNLLSNKKLSNTLALKKIIAIPTTSGSGSDLTSWATVWDKVKNKKYSLYGNALYPEYSILDPNLTLRLPEKITLASALDSLSHATEAIWNKNANTYSNIMSKTSIQLIFKYLPKLGNNLYSIKYRTKIMEACMFAGLASGQTKTALSHALSYPLTLKFGLLHGIASSISLSSIIKLFRNKDMVINELAEAIGCNPNKETIAGLYQSLFNTLSLDYKLSDYRIGKKDFSFIIKEIMGNQRTKNFKLKITEDLLALVLSSMY